MKNLYTTILILLVSFSFAQQKPATAGPTSFILLGGTAHVGNGEVIENSLIQVENGIITKITSANEEQETSTSGQVYDIRGQHVYPGIIAPNSTLGLVEVDAVRATDDVNEIGSFLPHIRSIIAYDAESRIVESMRPSGVLMAQITPRGGRITGTSSVVQLDAWNWEDALVKEDDAIHINWPDRFVKKGAWYDPKVGYKQNEKYKEQVQELEDFFAQAKAYQQADEPKLNLVYQAMGEVFTGDKAVFVSADSPKDILDALEFKRRFNLSNFVIVGGRYAHQVTKELKAANVAVLANRVHSTPEADDDDYDLSYKLPKLLHEAGVLVALENSGQMERMNSRNFPFYAGQVVAEGLSKEEALQLITLNPAKILGIDDQYGSLEEGKLATLFVSAGDALDMQGNRLSLAFIDGRKISLESHHTQLYKKYKEKYKEESEE